VVLRFNLPRRAGTAQISGIVAQAAPDGGLARKPQGHQQPCPHPAGI